MTKVIYRLVGEHGQLGDQLLGQPGWDIAYVCKVCWCLPLTSACPATVAWWYWCLPWRWCKGKEQTKIFTWSSLLQSHKRCGLDGIRCRRSLVLGFPAERDFRFSSALRLMAQLPTASHKRCSNQVIKFCKTRTSLMPCAPNLFKYKHFRTGRQIPSLFLLISFTTGFSSWHEYKDQVFLNKNQIFLNKDQIFLNKG